MGLAASARRERAAEAAVPQQPPPPMTTARGEGVQGSRPCKETAAVLRPRPTATAGRERVQGLRCCEETAALRHPRIVTAEIPVRAAGAGAGAYGRPRDWSALPDLPLSVVARRLHTLKDFLSFRGVCTSWRCVGTEMVGDVMASQPPLFFSTLRCFYHPGEKRWYRRIWAPGDGRNIVVGVSHGYVILRWPCSRTWSPGALESNYRKWPTGDWPCTVNPLTGALNNCFPRSTLNIWRALLSSPPTSPGCVLVAHNHRCIHYCRPGDKQWCEVHPWWDNLYGVNVISVAIVRGKGYALFCNLGLASFDFTAGNSMALTLLHPMPDRTTAFSERFLAESNGELFALPARQYGSGQFLDPRVCRFDTLSSKWVNSDDLGGRAVLVDRWKGAVFVDSFETWGGSKDCMYACDPCKRMLWQYTLKDPTLEPSSLPFVDQPDQGDGFWFLVLPQIDV